LKNFQHFKKEIQVTNTYEEIIRELVYHRKEQGISQEELAHRIGCAKSLVHKWEQYKRVPSGFLFSCWIDALALTLTVNKKKIRR
jgi:ribosome-binding protein aMBF1 (putative translation factor)